MICHDLRAFVLTCFMVSVPLFALNETRYEVNSPAQPLEIALEDFKKRTGIELVFPETSLSNAQAPAIKGNLTAEDWLDALFVDSGFSFTYSQQGKVIITATDIAINLVVGTQIKGLDAESALPVSVMKREEIETVGANTFEEYINSVPFAGGVEISGASQGPNDARGDVASINLRGLGSGNTLVLLNGRRIVAHPTSQAVSYVPTTVVNVNAIPMAAIERVEVLRDGASALYGADATAGVVNTVLSNTYKGIRASLRHGGSEGTGLDESQLNFQGGWTFNDDRTHVSLFASYFDRTGMYANERWYAENIDKRDYLPPEWEGNTDFRNLSTRSPYGEFQAGSIGANGVFRGVRVRQDSSSVTSGSGRFHVQPNDEAGGIDWGNGLDVDDGSLNTSLRYNFNIGRQITPHSERANLYTRLNHKLPDDYTFFAELGYYDASSQAVRSVQPLDDGLAYIIVPKENYYNPFGSIDSPNRLPNINAPEEGLDVLIRRYRPVELGGRTYDVDSDTLRLVSGIRSTFGSWDWELGLVHSSAETTDITHRKMSKTLLTQQLGLSTPEAFNPFGGPNANTQSVLDAVSINSIRRSETGLNALDFKVSNPLIWELPGGFIGAAFGLEWRYEDYLDDRDPRLDGTIIFNPDDISDQVGTSPTFDSDGSRHVGSAYGEFMIPLIGEGNRKTGLHRLDLQIAARYENFSDVGDILKPKFALSFYPIRQILLRASYSEGFRAPNLVQINEGEISRLTRNQEDFWRSDVTDLADDTGETYRRSLRQGNQDLVPEETETTTFGLVIEPIRNLTLAVDYWKIEQVGVIDNFGVEESLALDFLLRQQGSFNPNVVRFPVTEEDQAFFDAWNAANPNDQRAAAGLVEYVIDPYLNLDPRTVEGTDFSLLYRSDRTSAGRFTVRIDANLLRTYEQQNQALAPLLNDPRFAEEFTAVAPDRIQINGNPELRYSASLSWRYRAFGVGFFSKHIGEFYDTSAVHPDTGEFWTVEDWTTHNLNLNYTIPKGPLKNLRLRIGARNITDEDPPLADESLGYFTSYHNNRGRFIYTSLQKKF